MNAVSAQSGTGHASTAPGVRSARRFGVVAALAVAAMSLTSCAVGQHAATAIDKPAIAGTGATIGSIDLQDVSIQAPDVASQVPSKKFYQPGEDAPMVLTLINVGHTPDTLTSVTSTAFTSWNIVQTGGTGGTIATSQAIGPNERVGLGLNNLGGANPNSPQTLVLRGLRTANGNLYPGATVDVTFTFATAGTITLHVPVDLSSVHTTGSIAPIPTQPGI